MKKLFLFFAVLATAITAKAENYILYTSTDGQAISSGHFMYTATDVRFVSNTYEDGQGKIVFDGEITYITTEWFEHCTNLSSITIPNSVTGIYWHAFYDCPNLTSVEIQNPNTVVSTGAFEGCTSLPVVENIRYADHFAVEVVDKSLPSYTIQDRTVGMAGYLF